MPLRQRVQSNPITSYFLLTFLISWGGAGLYLAPRLLKGQQLAKLDGLLMFPIMLLGPAIAGIALTSLTGGKAGLGALRAKLGKARVGMGWYLLAVAIPAVLILVTLFLLNVFYSPVFRPNFFPIGIVFGIPAGLLEEIGWSGFVFPVLQERFSLFKSALIIGVLWAIWHLPVIDFLGAASPHGHYLWAFFTAFAVAMTAMRVIICCLVRRTGSLLLAQFTHILSTGCLVVLGPNGVTPGQEAAWYALYGLLLWGAAAILFRAIGRSPVAG
ncbi:MAG TPA: CPBP family intramembrane glutamic endopeptidase [Verrucomicrobiae bacterium]|nr:CPBP family intramembrane glutamic endopeptidase [Verrucomicrobiae bacterium]